LQTITITPSDSSVAAGSTLQFTATGNFSGGYTEDITNSPYLYWSSSDRTIASFYYWWFWFFNNHSKGLVRGISAGGPVTITATVRWWNGSAINVSGTTSLTVTSPEE
jgi:trimeric autotransporter adhesin